MSHVSLMKSLSKYRILLHLKLNPLSALGRVGQLGGTSSERIASRAFIAITHALQKRSGDPKVSAIYHLWHHAGLRDFGAAARGRRCLGNTFSLLFSISLFLTFLMPLIRIRGSRSCGDVDDRLPIPALGLRP